MDVDFVLSDSMEAVRPKLEMPKTIEDAAKAVDEMFNSTFQAVAVSEEEQSDEGSDRDEDEERRDGDRGRDEDVDGEEPSSPVSSCRGSTRAVYSSIPPDYPALTVS